MDQSLNKISDEYGYPADLVSRAAAARAQVEGISREAVAARWAGEEVPEGGAAPAAAPAAVATTQDDAATPAGLDVEVLEAVGHDEPDLPDSPSVVDEPSPVGGFVRWLAIVAFIIPVIALTYAFVAPDGPACGAAGQLDVDPATGNAVGCDGKAYGAGAVNFFALGQDVYTAQCVACHAADGSGGVGPAFFGGSIVETFPANICADHLEWITLGSSGWQNERGNTYGASAKPVLGFSGVPMPGFSKLTADELSAVAIYQRVAFGGEEIAIAEASCLVSAAS
ncbi:MAG: cytochrome c [Acidobacteria bacterium]|nr:cytochrome c [Acidobacteriota bacterium]